MKGRVMVATLAALVAALAVAPGAVASGTDAVGGAPVGVPASAAPGDEVTTTAATTAGTVNLRFKVRRFVVRDGRLLARTLVTATYTGTDGQTATTSKVVTMTARTPALRSTARHICEVLFLRLENLDLNLLGLRIQLVEPVTLRITANRRGGILGRLFCSLAAGMRHQSLARTARQLNRSLANTAASTFQFRFPLAPSGAAAQQQQECLVLELILGPLELRLLGLRVQLSRVHLRITGIPSTQPGGGILGDLLCALARQPLPTTP